MLNPRQQADIAHQRFRSRLKETGACTWLLVALIMMLLLYPLLDETFLGRVILSGLNSTILVAGVFAASGSRRALLTAVVLAVPTLTFQWLPVINHEYTFQTLIGITTILFYVFAIGQVLTYVLQPGEVTGNKLHGAIDAYIMTALLWTMIYVLIEHLEPGSFAMTEVKNLRIYHWPEFLFFSFTTLTTTGYGDTVPVTGVARSAVILEQLAGTFYVAILIARLAGLYQPRQADRLRDRH